MIPKIAAEKNTGLSQMRRGVTPEWISRQLEEKLDKGDISQHDYDAGMQWLEFIQGQRGGKAK